MNLIKIAVTFFLVANPIGNSPVIIGLIKDFDFDKQKKIMLRESILALFFALFFQYLGRAFLGQLDISIYTLRISGGLLLLLVALNMIFPSKQQQSKEALKREPFFVPIATPLIAGPALLTIIMFYSQQENDNLKISAAIGVTWIFVTASLLAAPYMNKILRKRGLAVLEQLMGLFLTAMAVGMITQGTTEFIQAMEFITKR